MKIISGFMAALLFPSIALACQCKEQNINSNYKNAAMVVYAHAQDYIASPSGEGGTVVLVIHRWWKASSPKKIVVNSLTNCNFDFEVGNNYLLFLNIESNGLYYTDNCAGNKKLKSNNEYSEPLTILEKNNYIHSKK